MHKPGDARGTGSSGFICGSLIPYDSRYSICESDMRDGNIGDGDVLKVSLVVVIATVTSTDDVYSVDVAVVDAIGL